MSNKFKNPWGDNNNDDNNNIEELFKKSQEKLNNLFRQRAFGGGGGYQNNMLPIKTIAYFVIAVFVLLWLASGFYTIQPDEEGVVLRLGSYNRTTTPGLHWKIPSPIETMTKVSVTRVNKEEVGFRSAGKRITSRQQLLESTVSNESQMLTTDENIVDINLEIQWMISDAKDYLFNVRDLSGENTVKSVAESAIREVIGLTKISDVLAEERSQIEQSAKTVMQSMLDNYKMGVRVMRVQLLRVEPPQEVIDAYRDVQNAKQDKEREINRSMAHRNDIVPRARGEAEKIILEAEAYKQKVIAEAKGEASRFAAIYDEYKNAKDVTKKRMYLETMEEIMSGMDKIIVDKNTSQNLLPYLPLDGMKSNKQTEQKSNKE